MEGQPADKCILSGRQTASSCLYKDTALTFYKRLTVPDMIASRTTLLAIACSNSIPHAVQQIQRRLFRLLHSFGSLSSNRANGSRCPNHQPHQQERPVSSAAESRLSRQQLCQLSHLVSYAALTPGYIRLPAHASVSRPCKTRGPDQEQFYFNENVKGRLQMHNSTSRVIYSLSTNPYVDEAYLITDPASQWSNFVVERGEGQLASGVRIRNVFNNRCLTSKGGADPTFMECRWLNGNQASLPSRII